MWGAPLALVKLVGFFVAWFGVFWRVLGMPQYEYEALDASGKSVAGTISCRDEQQALEGLDKSGLHPTKLTRREETPPTPAARPIVRIVAGLLGILFFWGFYVARNDPDAPPGRFYFIPCIFLAYAILGNKLGGMWTKRPY